MMLFPTGDAAARVLFLDDMEWRHSEFRRISENLGNVRVEHAYTASQAMELLSSGKFDQVFLDHDLSEEDVMVAPGGATIAPTGMDVVEHILRMEVPPTHVVVHSCNGPAAAAMHVRLETHPLIQRVTRVPFPSLVRLVRP